MGDLALHPHHDHAPGPTLAQTRPDDRLTAGRTGGVPLCRAATARLAGRSGAWRTGAKPYRDHWHWSEHAPVLVLASLLSGPYTWIYDQGLLAVSLVQVAALMASRWWQF